MKVRFFILCLITKFWLYSFASMLQSQVNDKEPNIRIVQVGFSANLFYEVDSRDAEVAIKIWTRDIFKAIRDKNGMIYEPNVTIYNDFSALKKSLMQGNVEFLSISTLDYFELKGKFDFEPILMGEFKGKVGEENILLVHKERGFTTLEGLQDGDLIVHPGQRGVIAQMWLSVLLMSQGLPECEKFFATIRTFNKASQGILPVFFKQIDACVVNRQSFETMIDLNPQLKEQLQILAISPVFAYGLNLLSNNFEPKMKNEIINIALNIDKHTRGKQILTLFRQDRAIPFEPHHLESLEQLIKNYYELKNQRQSR